MAREGHDVNDAKGSCTARAYRKERAHARRLCRECVSGVVCVPLGFAVWHQPAAVSAPAPRPAGRPPAEASRVCGDALTQRTHFGSPHARAELSDRPRTRAVQPRRAAGARAEREAGHLEGGCDVPDAFPDGLLMHQAALARAHFNISIFGGALRFT